MRTDAKWRWVFAASAETIEKVRELASQEPAIVIMKLIRAPNVDCVYSLCKYYKIQLTAGRRGGPTLAHNFREESFRNLQLAGARLGLDRYEAFEKFCDFAFTGPGAIDLIVNIITEGAPE